MCNLLQGSVTMSKQRYLWNRRGVYYFRLPVPSNLHSKFGCRELSCSLRTSDIHVAKYRSLNLQRLAQFIFMKLITGTKLLPEQVQAIAKAYFKEALNRLEAQMDKAHDQTDVLHKMTVSVERNTGQSVNFTTQDHIERLDYLVPSNYKFPKGKDGKRTGNLFSPFHFDGNTDEVLKYVIEENNLELEKHTPSYQALKKGVVRAVEELKAQHQKRLDFETILEIEDDWFREPAKLLPQLIVASNTPLFSAVYEEFLNERKGEEIKTINHRKVTKDLWLGVHGDISLTELSASKAREFKKALDGLPKNKEKIKAYKGKAIKELLDMNIPVQDKMSSGTKNTYIANLSTFMEWAIEQYSEYNLENHFVGKRFKSKSSSKDKRHSFSDEQLKILFSSPIYEGCAGENQVQRYQKGKRIIKDSLFWVPLIAAYSGARMEEILRLQSKDLYQDQGVWVFDINETDGKKRKSNSSIRKVPIHPDLIKLGILDHTRKSSKLLPFCDTPKSKEGTYSKEFSKKFGRVLRKYKVHKDKTSFHSFRHRFKDEMMKAGISKSERTALMGHEYEDVHDKVYGDADIPTKVLHNAIRKISYSFVEIKNNLIKVKA